MPFGFRMKSFDLLATMLNHPTVIGYLQFLPTFPNIENLWIEICQMFFERIEQTVRILSYWMCCSCVKVTLKYVEDSFNFLVNVGLATILEGLRSAFFLHILEKWFLSLMCSQVNYNRCSINFKYIMLSITPNFKVRTIDVDTAVVTISI